MLWVAGGAAATVLICCGTVVALTAVGDPEADRSTGALNTPIRDSSDTTPTATEEAPAEPPPAEPPPAQPAPPPPPPAATGVGDGTWLVPSDVKPGTYHVTVPADSFGCYWHRAKNAEGDLDSILANDNVHPGGHVIVTITKADKAFKTEGCGDWVSAPRSGPKAVTIGEGTWAIGIDIRPGTYAVTVPADSFGCYWQRTKNFTGNLESIIANDNVSAGTRATVTLKSTDKGFKSSGCGTWRRR
jgi:hypothetical protein